MKHTLGKDVARECQKETVKRQAPEMSEVCEGKHAGISHVLMDLMQPGGFSFLLAMSMYQEQGSKSSSRMPEEDGQPPST